jgi:hypothetical protein
MNNQTLKSIFSAQNALALTVGAALIVAVIVGGIFYATKKDGKDVLTVTGSARKEVSADTVIWRTAITRNVGYAELKTGYAQMTTDIAAVKAFLKSNNVADESITIQPVTMVEDWNNNGPVAQSFKRYTLTQNIEIKSADVAGITALAQKAGDLINQGVLFQSQGLEYYYTQLADLRVSMLGDAIADAKSRAQAMAKAGGQHVGSLQTASSGVVQVLSRGSVDVSDYGSYDTSKIDKDVMVTVRATFKVK